MHFKQNNLCKLAKNQSIYFITSCMPTFSFLVLKQLIAEIYTDFLVFCKYVPYSNWQRLLNILVFGSQICEAHNTDTVIF